MDNTKIYLDGTLFVSIPVTDVPTDKLQEVLATLGYTQFASATVDYNGETEDGYEVRFISPNKKLG